jgi:hypothetical protein
MEVIFSPELLVATYMTKERHNPGNHNPLFTHTVIISNLVLFCKFQNSTLGSVKHIFKGSNIWEEKFRVFYMGI